MSLENDVLDSLDDLKYETFDVIANDPISMTELKTFSAIIHWISKQLNVIAKLESIVNQIHDESDKCSFRIELNSLLRELNSPYAGIDLDDATAKMSILHYLCGELFSARIFHANRKDSNAMSIAIDESETARDLKNILMCFNMSKPPPNVTPQILFKKIIDFIKLNFGNYNDDSLLLPNGLTLSQKQWDSLNKIKEQINNDYTLRREMLIRRCECTIGSFAWKGSDKKEKSNIEKQINNVIETMKQRMDSKPKVSIADALAARQSDSDSLLNSVVSDTHVSCNILLSEDYSKANRGKQQMLQLQKFLIGGVPDRGGRPNEQPPPSKETFNQQNQQRNAPRGGRSDRGGRGRGRDEQLQQRNQGQRVQGAGWTQGGGNRYGQNSNRYGQSDNYNQYSHSQQQQTYGGNYGERSQNWGNQQNTRQAYQHYDQQQQYVQQQQPQQQQYYRQDYSQYDNSGNSNRGYDRRGYY